MQQNDIANANVIVKRDASLLEQVKLQLYNINYKYVFLQK